MSLKRAAFLVAWAAAIGFVAAAIGVVAYHHFGFLEFIGGEDGAPITSVSVPASLSAQAQTGQETYEDHCLACHGRHAAGRNGMAPPLVHVIYEPGHHGDESFQRAVAHGVRAHHWRFGDMPAIEGLTRRDVAAVVTYIRELQQVNGIQ